MSFNTPIRIMLVLAALFVCAASAAAQADLGPQRGATSSSSQLNLTANAQSAIYLDIETATGGATVTGTAGKNSTGVFSLDFGNVNGLGLGTAPTGVTVDTTNPAGALYTTPIKLTPRFSGSSSGNASVSVIMDGTSGNAAGRTATREGASAAAVAAPSTVLANIFTSTASNNTAITRYVGYFISNANGAGAVNGAISSRLVYQVTVP